MRVKLATRLEAIRMGGNAVFSDLATGDLFYFPQSPSILYVKLPRGRYTYEGGGGNIYRTGKGSAVVMVTDAQAARSYVQPKA